MTWRGPIVELRRDEAEGRRLEERFEAEETARARIGPSFGFRVYPRVRAVRGRKGQHLELAGPIRTRRAAFRLAREMRASGELRPLVVYPRVVPLAHPRGLRKTWRRPGWFVGVHRMARPAERLTRAQRPPSVPRGTEVTRTPPRRP